MNPPETKASERLSTSTLPQKLRMKADMINMGERIAWGSETALMFEAADYIESLEGHPAPGVMDELHIAATQALEHLINCERELDEFHGMGKDSGSGSSTIVLNLQRALSNATLKGTK